MLNFLRIIDLIRNTPCYKTRNVNRYHCLDPQYILLQNSQIMRLPSIHLLKTCNVTWNHCFINIIHAVTKHATFPETIVLTRNTRYYITRNIIWNHCPYSQHTPLQNTQPFPHSFLLLAIPDVTKHATFPEIIALTRIHASYCNTQLNLKSLSLQNTQRFPKSLLLPAYMLATATCNIIWNHCPYSQHTLLQNTQQFPHALLLIAIHDVTKHTTFPEIIALNRNTRY